MALQTATKLTYDDWVNLPDDGKHYELIDGELYLNPSPNTKHQRVLLNLLAALHRHVTESNVGEVFVSPFDVVLSNVDVFEPDILFIRAERIDIVTKANVQGAPDIVIEVLSESTRRKDETKKLDRYERSGVSEYWIVDPMEDAVRILRLSGARYERIIVGGAITSPLLPGFSLALKDVFAERRAG